MVSRKFFNSSRHSQDLSAVLGETLSPGDSHHIKNNTMDFKCLLRSIDGGKKVLGLGTIFQIASELGKVFPSQRKRSIPLASGHILLEAVSSQALYNIINKETVSFLGSRCKAILPHSLHKVEGVLAGIPENEDLACLGGRLTTSPRLVGVSFVTQTRLPRYVRVGDTSCVLRVSPKPIDPIRCYKCQGYGHYSNNCPSPAGRCAGKHNTKACSSGHKQCANCGAQHSASYRGCEAFSFYRKVAALHILVGGWKAY